jgi:proteasome lid subunit RPN8/RPN11
MNIGISRAVLDQILLHAAQFPDEEVCGLLFGGRDAITSAGPVPNVAADRRQWFELDPAALLAAHRAQRLGGRSVAGHYHSHPSGAALPSPRDAESAVAGAIWLIVCEGEVAAFEARQDGPIHGRFHPLALKIS